MLKTIMRVLITLFILTLLGAGAIFIYNSGRTYYNDESTVGNTTGNIINGGLFCEKDGKIYFSNDKADGSLYVMNSNLTKPKRLTDDKAVYINVDENYIYYVRANDTRENNGKGLLMFYNTGVFRIRRNGSGFKAFTGNPGAYLTLKGNDIYFQRYDVGKGLFLYRYHIDTTMEKCLVRDAVIPMAVNDKKLYYAGYSSDHNINTLNLESFTTHTAFEGSYLYPVSSGNYIYYMDPSEDYKIYRMNQDGSGPALLTDKRCSTYNITNSGKYLYYQVDDSVNNGLYRLNLETMEDEQLLSGNYKQINVTDNYVFFKDFDNSNTYVVEADGIAQANIFDPSASEAK